MKFRLFSFLTALFLIGHVGTGQAIDTPTIESLDEQHRAVQALSITVEKPDTDIKTPSVSQALQADDADVDVDDGKLSSKVGKLIDSKEEEIKDKVGTLAKGAMIGGVNAAMTALDVESGGLAVPIHAAVAAAAPMVADFVYEKGKALVVAGVDYLTSDEFKQTAKNAATAVKNAAVAGWNYVKSWF